MHITDGRTRPTAGPPGWVNRVVRAVLRSPAHRLLDARLCELRYRTPRTGRPVAFPVAYALDGGRVVVMAAEAGRKRWWRAFRHAWPVSLVLRGQVRDGIGRVVDPSDPGYAQALFAYRLRHRVPSTQDTVLLVVDR